MEENKKNILTRRDALKTLAAITGAATLASLPGRWQTPVVQVGALPAHAQCSFVSGTATIFVINDTTGTYTVTFSWPPFSQTVTLGPGQTACVAGAPVDAPGTVTESLNGSNCDQFYTDSFELPSPPEEGIWDWYISCDQGGVRSSGSRYRAR